MPVKPSRMRQRATRSREHRWATTGVKREPFGSIEGPAIRLQDAQSQRKFLTEMAFDQWPQSGVMAHPVVNRFIPD